MSLYLHSNDFKKKYPQKKKHWEGKLWGGLSF